MSVLFVECTLILSQVMITSLGLWSFLFFCLEHHPFVVNASVMCYWRPSCLSSWTYDSYEQWYLIIDKWWLTIKVKKMVSYSSFGRELNKINVLSLSLIISFTLAKSTRSCVVVYVLTNRDSLFQLKAIKPSLKMQAILNAFHQVLAL